MFKIPTHRPYGRHRSLPVLALVPALALGALDAPAAPAAAQDLDTTLIQDLDYRMIGPFRGGRVTAVDGVPGRRDLFYMGSTGGGVWVTEDAGETWTNISDQHFDVASIGAVEVADADPNVIYVGTGSACIRGNVSTGRGVYRSVDAGESWDFVGLPESGAVGKIVTDPRDPDVVFVAALGHIFGPNPERGLYRSRDGGATWQNVLFTSDSTGAVDVAINPANPRIVYAAMWRAERKPWTLIDGALEGGVYRSRDGGDSWEKLTDGLPAGPVGRIGIDISAADPDRVWALVTAEPGGGVFRSDDRGDSWELVSDNRALRTRGWYYSHINADPTDPNTVYVENGGFWRSIDGGHTWDRVRVPHGDVHDLWISPDDADVMVVGNDGGAQVSLTGGASWSTMHNQPTAELYRVTADNQWPYRVYGAQQDNSTISVPSASTGALTPESEWYSVAGAESGHIVVHPEDPDVVYSGNYIGRIDRYDHRTGRSRNVILYPQMQDGVAPKHLKYRFQWNAPILISRHDPDVVYHASNYVHRTRDGGMSWETMSPDLTTDNEAQQELPGGPLQHDHTGVEVYNTVFALAESPTPGELWAGSDDGRIHITRDDGATWTDITPRAMPEGGTVNVIETSEHRPGKAYAVVYRYREDDWRPYVFRTEDRGRRWRLLTDGDNGIPADHPVRVVREDPEREGLLYAGTEFGLFISLDDGESWQPFRRNLPVTPVTDLAVHRGDLVVATQGRSFWILDDGESWQPFRRNLPATPVTDLAVHRGDLVVATQGRSFWILDDLSPVRQLTDDVASADLHLYRPRPAYQLDISGFRGDRAPEGPARGAIIDYLLGADLEEPLALEILDADGTVLRTFSSEPDSAGEDRDSDEDPLPAGSGHNRFIWDLQVPGPEIVDGAIMSLGYTGGAWAPPGTYTVRLSAGDLVRERTLELRKDPRMPELPVADLRARYELTIRVRDKVTEVHDGIARIRAVRDQARAIADRVQETADDDVAAAVREQADTLATRLTAIEEQLIQTRNQVGQDPLNFPPKLDNQLVYLYGHVNAAYGRPTEGSYTRFDDLLAEVDPLLDRLRGILETDVPAFNVVLRDHGLDGVIVPR